MAERKIYISPAIRQLVCFVCNKPIVPGSEMFKHPRQDRFHHTDCEWCDKVLVDVVVKCVRKCVVCECPIYPSDAAKVLRDYKGKLTDYHHAKCDLNVTFKRDESGG